MSAGEMAEEFARNCCRSESSYLRTAWCITTRFPENNDYGSQYIGMWQSPVIGSYLHVDDLIGIEPVGSDGRSEGEQEANRVVRKSDRCTCSKN